MRDKYQSDYDVNKSDIVEAKYRIEALCKDYNDRPIYQPAVDKVFYDVFGVRDVGYYFSRQRKSRRELDAIVDIFERCNKDRLADMMLDKSTYYDFQLLVQLCIEIAKGRTKEKQEKAMDTYRETVEYLQDEYGITSRVMTNISNPLEILRKRNRERDDRYDGYSYSRSYRYVDDDYDRDRYYDDRDRDRRRRRDDIDEDEYFAESIIAGTDPDIIKRCKSSRGSRKSSSSKYRRDYDDDDDDDCDFEESTAKSFETMATAFEKLNDRLTNLETRRYPQEAPRRAPEVYEPEPNQDMMDVLDNMERINRNMQILMQNQESNRADLDYVMDAFRSYEASNNEDEAPGDKHPPTGDLHQVTGGVITDPKQMV